MSTDQRKEQSPDDCFAELHLADDYGDNQCTVHCQLPIGHDLPHCERFMRGGLPVVITWHTDDRKYDQGKIE